MFLPFVCLSSGLHDSSKYYEWIFKTKIAVNNYHQNSPLKFYFIIFIFIFIRALNRVHTSTEALTRIVYMQNSRG